MFNSQNILLYNGQYHYMYACCIINRHRIFNTSLYNNSHNHNLLYVMFLYIWTIQKTQINEFL